MLSKSTRSLLITVIIFFGYCHSAFAEPTFNNVTILISSCDKYAPLWDPFFESLFKHWPSLNANNRPIPILLIANKKVFVNSRVQTLNIPNEKSWSDNMLEALRHIDTKYVILFLDDYWVTEMVDEAKLATIYHTMQDEQMAMVQLAYNNTEFHVGEKHPTLAEAIYTDRYARYKASLQLAIWDKEALQYLLKSGESPWDFEIAGTARSHGYPGIFLNIAKNYPIKYLNASRQGHIEQFAIDYALNNGIKFNRGDLPVVDGFSYRIAYNAWKKRAIKLWGFLSDPGAYYKTN